MTEAGVSGWIAPGIAVRLPAGATGSSEDLTGEGSASTVTHVVVCSPQSHTTWASHICSGFPQS